MEHENFGALNVVAAVVVHRELFDVLATVVAGDAVEDPTALGEQGTFVEHRVDVRVRPLGEGGDRLAGRRVGGIEAQIAVLGELVGEDFIREQDKYYESYEL